MLSAKQAEMRVSQLQAELDALREQVADLQRRKDKGGGGGLGAAARKQQQQQQMSLQQQQQQLEDSQAQGDSATTKQTRGYTLMPGTLPSGY